jgi:antirestriction protein ArdC
MKAEQARKLTDQALETLAKALEQGGSENLTDYLAAMAKFHQYSFGNILLIMLQNPRSTHVAGYRTWQNLGRQVRKGEKGITIVAPMIIRKKDDNADDDLRDEKKNTFVRFKAVRVFDISQTDGEPLPTLDHVQGNPSFYGDRLKQLVARKDITLTYSPDLGGADGMSTGGAITLLEGLEPAHEFSVLVHELAHELLHRRDADSLPSRTVRETEAEAVAFVVSHAIGLETNTAASDYIRLYQGDKTTLAASLDRIQKSAAEIIEAIASPDDESQIE